MKAIIFFGHGARDMRWRDPFDRMVDLWRAQHPQIPVQLAFLEMMEPTLAAAVELLSATGVTQIKVIPVFFGHGGHLRNDFPILLDACREKYPQLDLSVSSAVGEEKSILQGIVDFAARLI